MSFQYLILFCTFSMCIEMIHAHELVLEKIENAFEHDDFLVFDGLRVKKINRTSFAVNGKYDLKVPLDDEIDMLLHGNNFQGGQYKKMFEKKMNQFCKALYQEQVEKQYSQFYEASTDKVPFGSCPYPAGKNELVNMMIDENGALPAYIPGGERWRMDVRFLKKGKVLGGYNVYILLRSEQSLLKGG